MEKRIKNSSGDLLIRETDNCGIVEMLHLFNENKFGCVIGCWNVRKCDGEDIAEFSSIHNRIMNTDYDDNNKLLEALKYGQRLADLILLSNK